MEAEKIGIGQEDLWFQVSVFRGVREKCELRPDAGSGNEIDCFFNAKILQHANIEAAVK